MCPLWSCDSQFYLIKLLIIYFDFFLFGFLPVIFYEIKYRYRYRNKQNYSITVYNNTAFIYKTANKNIICYLERWLISCSCYCIPRNPLVVVWEE